MKGIPNHSEDGGHQKKPGDGSRKPSKAPKTPKPKSIPPAPPAAGNVDGADAPREADQTQAGEREFSAQDFASAHVVNKLMPCIESLARFKPRVRLAIVNYFTVMNLRANGVKQAEAVVLTYSPSRQGKLTPGEAPRHLRRKYSEDCALVHPILPELEHEWIADSAMELYTSHLLLAFRPFGAKEVCAALRCSSQAATSVLDYLLEKKIVCRVADGFQFQDDTKFALSSTSAGRRLICKQACAAYGDRPPSMAASDFGFEIPLYLADTRQLGDVLSYLDFSNACHLIPARVLFRGLEKESKLRAAAKGLTLKPSVVFQLWFASKPENCGTDAWLQSVVATPSASLHFCRLYSYALDDEAMEKLKLCVDQLEGAVRERFQSRIAENLPVAQRSQAAGAGTYHIAFLLKKINRTNQPS